MDNQSSDQRLQSEDQTEAQTETRSRREDGYHGTGGSEVALFRLIVRSVCGAKRDK
jgi:hypothetical protein